MAADPALAERPVSAVVFFCSFLFVILWIIVPLILAIVYDFYKVRTTIDGAQVKAVTDVVLPNLPGSARRTYRSAASQAGQRALGGVPCTAGKLWASKL